MMLRYKFVFLLFLFTPTIYAAHIVGGDITYECLSVDTAANVMKVKITAIFYRDNISMGAPFDPKAEFGIFSGANQKWKFVRSLRVDLQYGKKIKIINPNPCLDVPPDIGVDEGKYSFTLVLPIINENYIIAYQRCCRNNSITNIYDPGGTGAAFFIEISSEAQKTCNSSPVFNDFPPIVICADDDLYFDHSASDSEGDQIVYEFCNPLAAGGKRGSDGNGGSTECDGVTPSPSNCGPPFNKVQYVISSGYSFIKPIPGNPAISIDPNTGIISGYPTLQGQYVVGVCAKEYRGGILIGEIRRDFQFNVAKCNPLVYADINSENEVSIQEFELISCGENTVSILNTSYLEKNIKSYLWEFDILGTIKTFDTRNVEVTFPDIGIYSGRMVLNPGTQCADSAEIKVSIYPSIYTDFTFDYDTCSAGLIDFQDKSVTGSGVLTDWKWNMNGESIKFGQTTDFLFPIPGIKQVTLVSTDINACKDTMTKDISYYPIPNLLVVEPSNFVGCAPSTVFFNNLTSPIDSAYFFTWDFGDGEVADGHIISPYHVYQDPGVYSVDLKIVSPIGCETSKSFPSWIEIKEKPFADFSFSPDDPTVFNNIVSFTNQSMGEEGYNWNFGIAGNSFDENPIVTFQDTGFYNIRLIVKNHLNCTDTAFVEFDVVAPVLLFFPNAFTPNNDASNDVFIPKGYFSVIAGYELLVFNRWGEMIFKSNDPVDGWNGKKNNTGELSPVGTYIYLAKYLDEFGKLKTNKGHINLLR